MFLINIKCSNVNIEKHEQIKRKNVWRTKFEEYTQKKFGILQSILNYVQNLVLKLRGNNKVPAPSNFS